MNIIFAADRSGFAEVFDPPTPASDHVPDWYKQTQNFVHDGLNEIGVRPGTVKQCMPVIDAITAGYIFTTPSDIWFGYNEDGSRAAKWSIIDYEAISSHSLDQLGHAQIPRRFDPVVYKLNSPWVVKTPPGYSCLFTQPFWRFDTPFYVHTGIVDTDRYPRAINFPFWIESGFEGIVPNGTPIVQIIPFKRDEWNATLSDVMDESKDSAWMRATRFSFNRYKRLWREKKTWK